MKNKLQLTETWNIMDMIATQVIAVAVKNMATMKIFVTASFMVTVFLQSERVCFFALSRHQRPYYVWPLNIALVILKHCTQTIFAIADATIGLHNLQCHLNYLIIVQWNVITLNNISARTYYVRADPDKYQELFWETATKH